MWIEIRTFDQGGTKVGRERRVKEGRRGLVGHETPSMPESLCDGVMDHAALGFGQGLI
jgi:hypothetical protein